MAGPGKGLLKRSVVQKSSSTRDIQNPLKSSSSHGVPQHHKSSSSHGVPPHHKSSSSHGVPPHHKSTSSHGVLPHLKCSSSHGVPQHHKSSSSHDASETQRHVLSKGQSYYRLQDEELPMENPYLEEDHLEEEHLEEDHLEEDNEVNSQQTETYTSDHQHETGSPSHGTSGTRKESRALSETRKRRINKGKFIFEVDECAGRIVGDDSQQFITKGGCLMREYAKFDGTTWRNQSHLLKMDIISKCTENSTYDPSCRLMERAIQTQLGYQHKNRRYKFHLHYQKYLTKEDAIRHPPNGIKPHDWVNLCERFASEEFQKLSHKNKRNQSFNKIPPAVGTMSIARIVNKKRKEGEVVSAIDQYKIGHFSKKTNKMINDKADEILNELLSEEADSSCSAVEICLKKLNRIPGHIKGRSVSTKQILATENLRIELQLEKEKSKALEEKVRLIEEEQVQSKEAQIKYQMEQNEKMEYMMRELARLSRLQYQIN